MNDTEPILCWKCRETPKHIIEIDYGDGVSREPACAVHVPSGDAIEIVEQL